MNPPSTNKPPLEPVDYTKVPMAEIRGFEQLCGQTEAISRLKTLGDLYRGKNGVPEHILLSGPDGMGKRTIAQAFAKTYSSVVHQVEARDFMKRWEMTAILTSLDNRSALLILNLQDMREPIATVLRPAMEEFKISLIIGQGPGVRIHPFPLGQFTCIATAPKESDVSPDLLKCFSLRVPLRPYTVEESERLVILTAIENGLNLGPEVVAQVVSVCGGNPNRIAQLLRRFARLGKKQITAEEAAELLSAFGLNPQSLVGAGSLTNLDALTGTDFEQVITLLLDRMGFHTEVTKASGDGGIDIVAHLEKPIVGGRYLIQCKRFDTASQVGAPLVREFYGAVVADRKAIKGIFVTTSTFTAQAREFAQALPLELIDGNQLKILLEQYKAED